ncbi:MAG: hypothetical protein Q8M29_15545 [Bacteroidota bacterium]|nr:hypothetical protein [Bacteroidota bacterium]
MKIKFTLGVCAIALLTACGGGNNSTEAEKEFDLKPYNDSLANFIKDNKGKLDSLLINMETFAKEADAGKHKTNYKFKLADSTLNFSPCTYGYSTFNAPVKAFNAIYLSNNALLGTPLPENMVADIFIPRDFVKAKDLIKTGKTDHGTLNGESLAKEMHNDRVLLESYLNLKYLIYIRNDKYSKGVISAILSTYDIPVLDGTLYIFDLKNKKFCGAGEFSSSGPKELLYTYKENDISDQQYQAEKTLESQTPDTIKYKTIKLLKEFVNVDEESID